MVSAEWSWRGEKIEKNFWVWIGSQTNCGDARSRLIKGCRIEYDLLKSLILTRWPFFLNLYSVSFYFSWTFLRSFFLFGDILGNWIRKFPTIRIQLCANDEALKGKRRFSICTLRKFPGFFFRHTALPLLAARRADSIGNASSWFFCFGFWRKQTIRQCLNLVCLPNQFGLANWTSAFKLSVLFWI